MSCAAESVHGRALQELSCSHPPIPLHSSNAAAAPDTQQIRENSLIQHLPAAFLNEIGQH